MPDHIDEAVLARAPRLRIVSCCLKGCDNFDVEACGRRGVLVTVLPDLLTEPTAELAVGLMIAAGRHVLAGDADVRRGAFQGWRPRFYGAGLSGSTVGIVGFGAIGRAVAERLVGFRSTVHYWDVHRLGARDERRLKATYRDLDTLLAVSGFVVLALLLDAETRHLVDDDRLARVRPGAILVNVARGSLVDEAAVARALRSGRLGFYAADAFELEDRALPDRPRAIHTALLADRRRTLFTPHLGSAVSRVREAMALRAAQNIVDFFDGRMPPGAVNADVLLRRSPATARDEQPRR
jgi:phosphonate dehydrogenase